MKFPEEYVLKGNFTLHSGRRSGILYDVNSLLTNGFYRERLMENLPESEHYVGIATGGAIIASLMAERKGKNFSMIHDGVLKGKTPENDYVLIDDVITTGESIKRAVKIIKRNPLEICVAFDRREENKNPKVSSVFEKS